MSLVLIRQIVTLVDNARLSARLQFALLDLSSQAQALEVSNRDLQTEIEMRKRAEEQLLHDTLHDSLTGLPNRVLFLDRLRHDIAYSHRHPSFHFSVLFLDIDHFKTINDGLGHDVGDKLLIEIAAQLRTCVREGDTVARLGGDEFVILLEDAVALASVSQVSELIQERLKGPYEIDGHNIYASASIGVVHHQQELGQAEELLRDADVAMYQAKANGRARSEVFNPALRERLLARMELERDLRCAIENQEFRLFYQPIVSVTNGSLYGFEALLRWEHPEHGLIQPQEFIKLAEDTGQIVPLGCWSLREACRQMAVWQQQFPEYQDLTISVNISALQFRQIDLVEQVASILAETGLEGRHLGLEITESVYLHNPETANVTLNRLKDLGVSFHIDDFGTGYSSLSYLHSFPIGAIKIDRSFTFKIGLENHSEIVRTIISLAHDLGMLAIAEGVDKLDQLVYLRTYGCDYAQGYLFSMPLSCVDVEAKLAAGLPTTIFHTEGHSL
jgi:diguanylate cyclase (GGDEF)-like protein